MRDLVPEDYALMEKVREAFIKTARTYGFKLMEPSPLELLKTLEAKSGAGIREEIYSLSDKSGRELGLRFDLTVGLTRYATSKRGVRLPIKLGAFSGMWRYDEPQYGRYRWFYQWDIEFFGAGAVEADAEVIDFTSALFREMGLRNISIEVGDRRMVEQFIRKVLDVSDEVAVLQMMRALDKVGKKTEEEIMKEYEQKSVNVEALKRLLEFGNARGPVDEISSSVGARQLEGAEPIRMLVESLDARGVANVTVNMGVVRGLDYYTGIVFEAFDKDAPNLGALAGGGRYDTLPGVFGRPDMTATGVAGGVERAILSLKKARPSTVEPMIDVYVAYANSSLVGDASSVATTIRRESDYSVELEIGERSLKRQMETASSLGARYVVLVAPKEYDKGKVIVKDMKSGSESRVKVSSVTGALK